MTKKPEPPPHVRPIRDIRNPAKPAPAKASRAARLHKNLKQPKVRIVLLVAIVLAGAVLTRNYVRTRDDLAQNDPVKLAAKLGESLELPADEAPTLATVKDAEKLRGQSFFEQAQDGDKVLIYPKSGKAVMYRPSTKKVIKYMPINLADSTK